MRSRAGYAYKAISQRSATLPSSRTRIAPSIFWPGQLNSNWLVFIPSILSSLRVTKRIGGPSRAKLSR